MSSDNVIELCPHRRRPVALMDEAAELATYLRRRADQLAVDSAARAEIEATLDHAALVGVLPRQEGGA